MPLYSDIRFNVQRRKEREISQCDCIVIFVLMSEGERRGGEKEREGLRFKWFFFLSGNIRVPSQ